MAKAAERHIICFFEFWCFVFNACYLFALCSDRLSAETKRSEQREIGAKRTITWLLYD
jgi:hypothetical protein